MHKILNGYFNSDFSNFSTFSTTSTKEHHFKLFKDQSRLLCTPNYFFNRIINEWDQLSATVVNSNSVNCFKSLLNNHLIDSRFVYEIRRQAVVFEINIASIVKLVGRSKIVLGFFYSFLFTM